VTTDDCLTSFTVTSVPSIIEVGQLLDRWLTLPTAFLTNWHYSSYDSPMMETARHFYSIPTSMIGWEYFTKQPMLNSLTYDQKCPILMGLLGQVILLPIISQNKFLPSHSKHIYYSYTCEDSHLPAMNVALGNVKSLLTLSQSGFSLTSYSAAYWKKVQYVLPFHVHIETICILTRCLLVVTVKKKKIC